MGLRVSRRWGPARIAYRLRLNPATVHKVLRRYDAPPLSWTDPATGCRLRAKPKARRYEHETPGDLVHIDVKKLGRIPDGGGHRVHGRAKGNRIKKSTKPGTAFIHNAVDDHSRLAYAEILTDEKKETASAFWKRANAWFATCGITVKRVLTDNGSAYRSHLSADTLGPITHKRTRPYRPQTTARSNGSTEPWNKNGPTPAPTPARPSASLPSQPSCTPTIITAATPRSETNHQPTAYPTSVDRTPRRPADTPAATGPGSR